MLAQPSAAENSIKGTCVSIGLKSVFLKYFLWLNGQNYQDQRLSYFLYFRHGVSLVT